MKRQDSAATAMVAATCAPDRASVGEPYAGEVSTMIG